MTEHPCFLLALDHSAIAGYLQAVGTLIAIGVAIWVPYDLDRRARARQADLDRNEAKRVQLSLLPLLYDLRSKTSDFLEEQSGSPSFLGVERDTQDFDSDFFSLVPKFSEILRVSSNAGGVQPLLNRLSARLFKIGELLAQNGKLQRDGYHAAWQNHRDDFLAEALAIHDLTDAIIGCIETHEA